ncbi:MAG: hypothetical protein OK457_09490 [Thaumarchaeota archaeon]|nr:hypothetical protein [Nitrososphaerota archaeon]
MRLAYVEGITFAILIPMVLYLVEILSLSEALSVIFLGAGAWTLVSAFAFFGSIQRMYYVAWGLILVSVSSFFVTKVQYATALIIVAVIAAIAINIATRNGVQRKAQTVTFPEKTLVSK